MQIHNQQKNPWSISIALLSVKIAFNVAPFQAVPLQMYPMIQDDRTSPLTYLGDIDWLLTHRDPLDLQKGSWGQGQWKWSAHAPCPDLEMCSGTWCVQGKGQGNVVTGMFQFCWCCWWTVHHTKSLDTEGEDNEIVSRVILWSLCIGTWDYDGYDTGVLQHSSHFFIILWTMYTAHGYTRYLTITYTIKSLL